MLLHGSHASSSAPIASRQHSEPSRLVFGYRHAVVPCYLDADFFVVLSVRADASAFIFSLSAAYCIGSGDPANYTKLHR